MPKFSESDLDAIALSFVRMPMVQWDQHVAGFDTDTRYEVERRLAHHAERYTRACAYLSRRMSGGNHDHAVKAQNGAARKVRQALGYTYANDKITF